MTTTYPGTTLAPVDETTPTNWGLLISTLSIPALAIPSALGINRFLSDGQDWTAGGVIAAAGFEGLNIGLSILDIKRPDLRETAGRVRFWSVATAITMNVLEHYRARTGGYETFDLMALLLALVASVPIAVLYVSMAGLIHGVKEHEAETADVATRLQTELETARTKTREAEQRARTAEAQASAATAAATRLQAERDAATEQARIATDEARQLRVDAVIEQAAATAGAAALTIDRDRATEDRDRAVEEARAATEEARQLRAELATATAEARTATTDRDRAAEAARQATEEARAATALRAEITELARKATEHEHTATAATRRATEHERQIHELRAQLEAASALPTRAAVAARLKEALDAGGSVAGLAKETGWKESTLRDMVAAA